jgi:hypothetical protein
MKKNTLGLLAVSMTMQMRRCNAMQISRWSTTRASRGATGRHHRAITRTVSPWRVRHGHRGSDTTSTQKKLLALWYDIEHHGYAKLE